MADCRPPQSAVFSMLVRPIDSLLPRASRSFGEKARNLAALARAGFPVPAGYAVASEAVADWFARILPESLRPERLFAGRTVAADELQAARERVLNAELDEPLLGDIIRAFRTLRDAQVAGVAVRTSSASDDVDLQFNTGAHLCVLNVRSESALIDAVRACYAQVFAPDFAGPAPAFAAERSAGVGLLIQAMVPAEVAGLMFTSNPLSGDPDEIVIDASYGLGISVSEGRVTPDTYRVHKQSGWIRDRVIADKRSRMVVAQEGGVVEEAVPLALVQKQALDEHMLSRLLSLAHRIEDHFGAGRDVEFAIAGEVIYVLDARPINAGKSRSARGRTRRRLRAPISHAGEIVWSQAPVGDTLSGVATPLTWSLLSEFAELGFVEALASYGFKLTRSAALLGSFRGRVYLNVTEIAQLAGQLPMLPLASFIPSVQRAELERLERDRPTFSAAGLAWRLPVAVARVTQGNLSFARAVARFEQGFEAELRRVERMDLRILSAAALDATLSDVHRLLDDTARMLLRAHASVTSTLMVLHGALRALVKERATRVEHVLLSVVEGIETATPGYELLRVVAAFESDPLGIARLAASPSPVLVSDLPDGTGRRALEGFFRQHGHHGARELELGDPRWREEPQLVLSTLRCALAHGEPIELAMKRRVDALRATADLEIGRLPLSARAPLQALLALARRSIRTRERLRAQFSQVVALLRAVALDGSRRISVREPEVGKDGAFYMTLGELHGVLRSEIRNARGLVRLRRSQYERDRLLADPPVTFVGFPPPLGETSAQSNRLEGLPASPGVVEGTIRVLRSAADVAALMPQEIIVTPTADLGWCLPLVVAAGLITEIGGPLSHASVVAREYGVAAVANVGRATHVLKTGDRVRVDGNAGSVEWLRNDG